MSSTNSVTPTAQSSSGGAAPQPSSLLAEALQQQVHPTFTADEIDDQSAAAKLLAAKQILSQSPSAEAATLDLPDSSLGSSGGAGGVGSLGSTERRRLDASGLQQSSGRRRHSRFVVDRDVEKQMQKRLNVVQSNSMQALEQSLKLSCKAAPGLLRVSRSRFPWVWEAGQFVPIISLVLFMAAIVVHIARDNSRDPLYSAGGSLVAFGIFLYQIIRPRTFIIDAESNQLIIIDTYLFCIKRQLDRYDLSEVEHYDVEAVPARQCWSWPPCVKRQVYELVINIKLPPGEDPETHAHDFWVIRQMRDPDDIDDLIALGTIMMNLTTNSVIDHNNRLLALENARRGLAPDGKPLPSAATASVMQSSAVGEGEEEAVALMDV